MRRGNGKRYTRFPVKIIEFESASFLRTTADCVSKRVKLSDATEETNRHSFVTLSGVIVTSI